MAYNPLHHGTLARLAGEGFLGADQPDWPMAHPELSDALVHATVRAALCIARDRVLPCRVLSRRAAWLVGETLRSLAGNRW